MYTDLLLDFSKIADIVDIYFKENYKKSIVIPKNIDRADGCKEVRYNVEFDGRKLFLTTFLKKNGKTSLKVREGKEQEEKARLAEFIKTNPRCRLAEKNDLNKSMTFSKVDFNSFIETISLIQEEEICNNVNIARDDSGELRYNLTGKYNDTITITYYKTTNNVRVQGTPLLLYNLSISYINELVDIDDVIDVLKEHDKQILDKSTIDEQFKTYMPNSYEKHTEKLKKSLLKSVYNLNVECQEYTCTDLVFEPLRALEGHIKITLKRDYKISASNSYGNLDMFKYDYDNEIAHLKANAKREILKIKDRVDYYEKAYKHIVIYRHKYFHWDYPSEFGQDETIQIDDVNEARTLIIDTLKLIDEYYIL